MNNKDFYKILGVSEVATSDDIKKAYRELAKKYHPDKHKGDKSAEEKFKDISEANAVLGNPQKRKQYDQMRKLGAFGGGYGGGNPNVHFDDLSSMFGGARPRSQSKGGFSFDGFGDIFNQFFGNSAQGQGYSQQRSRGQDVTAEITVPFDVAARGGKQIIAFSKGGRTQKLSVKIPAGSDDGKNIRLRGQGEPSINGGAAGDVLLTIRVAKHPQFTREGLDIYSVASLNIFQAALGCKVRVQTLDSGIVELKIPAGTQPEKLFKLKGLGVQTGEKKGDHFVRVNLTVPKDLSSSAKKTLKELVNKEKFDL